MGALEHPGIRAFFILAGGYLLTSLYIEFGGFFNWPPFGTYPNLGSLPWISVYLVSTLLVSFLDWIRFRGMVHKDLVKQGAIQS
jgi:hypothetical protein